MIAKNTTRFTGALNASLAESFLAPMKKYLLLLCVFAFTTGCESDAPIDDVTNADREVMLRSLGENVILPGYIEFAENSQILLSAVGKLTSERTQLRLDEAQLAWLELAKNWKRIEIFQQGVLDVESLDSLIHNIDYGSGDWTLRTVPVDSVALVAAINGVGGIGSAYVEALPVTLRSIPVLEYLLFAGGDAAVLDRLSIAPNAAQYREYLSQVASALNHASDVPADQWHEGGGNFAKTFAENYGNDIGSSLGMLVNDMISIAEVIKNEKIIRPMGLDPDLVEARPSEQSIAMIVENINGLESAFTADADGRTGKGIDELLRSIDSKVGDQDLVDAVMTQFDRVRAAAGEINAPLHIAVTTERDKVNDLLNQIQNLIKLLKADVMVALGVMLTGFEGDGD